jgi:hypothetical protein
MGISFEMRWGAEADCLAAAADLRDTAKVTLHIWIRQSKNREATAFTQVDIQ